MPFVAVVCCSGLNRFLDIDGNISTHEIAGSDNKLLRQDFVLFTIQTFSAVLLLDPFSLQILCAQASILKAQE